MPGRRATTAPAGPTPIEEVPPTAPPQPAPEPQPEPTPEPEEDDLISSDPDGDGPPNLVEERPTRGPMGFPFRMGMPDLAGWQKAMAEFATAQREDYPLTVHEAIAEVTRQIGHIAKDRRTEGGERYSFRGIDDVLAALHPILGDVGLVLLPGRMIEHRRETRATRGGGTLNVALVRVRYTLIGPDGSRTTGEAWGEAGDSGDKATQKALSQAYKSFALQTFSIPTEESRRDDPDVTNEPAVPFTDGQIHRAGLAWDAARQAEGYEQLAAIRQQAVTEGLLPVPLDGTPLGVLFDRRRAQIEGGAQ